MQIESICEYRDLWLQSERNSVEEIGDYEVRAVQWGNMNISFEKVGSDFDVTPTLGVT